MNQWDPNRRFRRKLLEQLPQIEEPSVIEVGVIVAWAILITSLVILAWVLR